MKLGIIGTGKIVGEALYALQSVKEIKVQAIYARPHSRMRGEEYAAQYSIPAVYTDYDALLKEADIDTVYIGLVNSAHFEYAKKALENGKHVILEKPFTATYKEAADLFKTAKAQKRLIFEAITVLHNEVMDKMREALPKLGKIRMMQGNFSQYSSRYDRYLAGEVESSFDPENLGGALRDINVYNIHYAVALFGAPADQHYYPNPGYNGIDTSGTLVLEYDGFSAVCTGAKDSDSPCFIMIQGEKGYMKIDGKPNVAPNLRVEYLDEDHRAGEKDPAGAIVRPMIREDFVPELKCHRMTGEFRDFAKMIDEEDFLRAKEYEKETLGVMRVLDGVTGI